MSSPKKVVPIGAAAFLAAGSELGRSSFPILKLTKGGVWVAGASNTPVTVSRFAADIAHARRGFTCFREGTVVDEMLVLVSLATRIAQDELPDRGPYEEGDGWRPAAALQLRAMETGEQFVFKTTSRGGLSATGDLLSKYGHRLETGRGGIPVIELAVSHYAHKRYGLVYEPSFPIVDWLDEDDPSTSPMIPSGGSPAPAAEKPDEGFLSDEIPF
jgi:hypothetical protein